MKTKIIATAILVGALLAAPGAGIGARAARPGADLAPYTDSARAAYTAGDYAQALRLYTRVAEHGMESAQLHYNIGNCHYKAGHTAQAILWYRRALKLDPTFEDASHNLAMAQLQIVDKIDPIAPPFYKRWLRSVVLWMSPNGWAWAALALFALTVAALFVLFSRAGYALRRASAPVAALALILALATLRIAAQAKENAVESTHGVVLSPSVTVRSTPHEQGTELFTIHDGLTVAIEKLVEGWYEIRLEDGRVGWLPQSDLAEV